MVQRCRKGDLRDLVVEPIGEPRRELGMSLGR